MCQWQQMTDSIFKIDIATMDHRTCYSWAVEYSLPTSLTVFDHRSLLLCEGLGGRWSTVFLNGCRLSILHLHMWHMDHVCRHTRWRSRFSKKGWRELYHFHSLRKIHAASGSISQTFGGLGALTRLGFWDLDDFFMTCT